MYSPRLEEFQKLAAQGNLIPVTRRLLADIETPLSAYRKIRGAGESFLFESVEGGEHIGRYSFVGCNPRALIRQTGNRVEIIENGKTVETFTVDNSTTAQSSRGANSSSVRDGLEVVERVMKKYRAVPVPGLPRFTGGAIGFIGYEFIHDVEPIVPRPPRDELGTPTMVFLIADQLLIFDRVAQTITVLVNAVLEDAATPEEAYENAVAEIERLVSLLEQPSEHRPVSVPNETPSVPFESNVPKDKFFANVSKAKEYITAGDIIQVVGSQRFAAPFSATPIDLYRAARSINPSPYMFLLEFNGFSLVGASPEIHVRCEDRSVEIRPIAGTRRRGATTEEDLALEKELLADPKERAEHVMLVDLARNDLGRVCDFGSVNVHDLMIIERYSHVMHIVSQVEGKLSADKTLYDLMRATFPAGTLSGAPKIRAMQIIAEMEQTARGPYGGCVGYFSFNGNLDTCITIRTALVKDGKAYVQAGGGWVNDSTPEAEFQETVNKAKAMLKAVALAESFGKE
ncbi:MAG TPA: anthranilate synthase component I [Verrucomicrobiae bacterium]|jgi:anthranilate synthase component 1|nr:anthranilate synthase component I [Verrucomicrobiae bacterium]